MLDQGNFLAVRLLRRSGRQLESFVKHHRWQWVLQLRCRWKEQCFEAQMSVVDALAKHSQMSRDCRVPFQDDLFARADHGSEAFHSSISIRV
jgi:hypothetical protein